MQPVATKRTIVSRAALPSKGAAGLCLGLLLAPLAVLLGSTSATAQMAAPAPQGPPKNYMNKSVFYLPVIIDDRVRGQLREILLYMKDDPAKPWMLSKRGQPWEKVFPFQPAQDGEYWFTVVTVDKTGRQTPADLTREGPGVVVVYDSAPPQVDIRPLPATSEGQCVQCEVRDPNLDATKTRFEYQTADKIWRAGDSVGGGFNVFCIPQQAAHNGMVRVTAADRAGNTATREVNLSGMIPGALNAGPPAPGQRLAVPPQAVQPVVHQQVVPQQTKIAQQLPSEPQGPCLSGFPAPVAGPHVDVPEPARSCVSQKPNMSLAKPPAQLVDLGSAPELGDAAKVSVPAAPKAAGVPPVRQLVNSTHVSLEYQLDQVGTNPGVGKVEVWITADDGQSWQRLGEDPDRRSPVELDLPGEGVYGVSLVVTNARGFGDPAPKSGDVPDYWIEVDASRPVAKLQSVRPGTGDECGVLWISWTAHDKNLTAGPVDLYYAVQRNGPWTVIARGLKNDGRYRWTPPMEVGTKAFVRMVVSDRAGNSTHCETPQAVELDDGIRLHAHVTGVAPQNSSPTPPSGH